MLTLPGGIGSPTDVPEKRTAAIRVEPNLDQKSAREVVDLKAELRSESGKAGVRKAPQLAKLENLRPSRVEIRRTRSIPPATTADSVSESSSGSSTVDDWVGRVTGRVDRVTKRDDSSSPTAAAKMEDVAASARATLDALDFDRMSEQARDAAAQVSCIVVLSVCTSIVLLRGEIAFIQGATASSAVNPDGVS